MEAVSVQRLCLCTGSQQQTQVEPGEVDQAPGENLLALRAVWQGAGSHCVEPEQVR